MQRKQIQPEDSHPTGGYTHGILTHSGLMFISGQVSKDPSDMNVGEGDISLQTNQVFTNIEKILNDAGGGFENLVKINIFMTDARFLPSFREGRDKHLRDVRPASTLVVVSALADPNWLLEIDAVADFSNF